MPGIVIVGVQWGDEGKGKATDLLGGRVDYVVKPNGGAAAAKQLVVSGECAVDGASIGWSFKRAG